MQSNSKDDEEKTKFGPWIVVKKDRKPRKPKVTNNKNKGEGKDSSPKKNTKVNSKTKKKRIKGMSHVFKPLLGLIVIWM